MQEPITLHSEPIHSKEKSKQDTELVCPKCHKGGWRNNAALKMHVMRVHTKAGKTGAMWARGLTKEQIRMRKLNYQRKLRARNIAKGLTGAGTPRKLPYTPRGVHEILDTQREAKRKYQRNWYRKTKNKQSRILSVYPLPGTEETKTEKGLSVEEAMLLSLLMKKYGTENE